MRELFYLTFVLLFHFTLGGRSPHADFIEKYYMKGGPEAGRYSDNLLEDAMLDVPGLIRKYGYPVEEHEVITEDGYVIGMHRIPHGRDNNNAANPDKPVVLVMHGLLSSSADFVINGPGNALAYILAEAGYDVWMGNARGNTYSRKHISLDPDESSNFWKFSWDEIGNYDLPAMVDHVLNVSRKQRLHYIGHSQGTTAFWAFASLRPEYNDKIISMQAFAPVAFFEYTRNPFFLTLGPQANSIELIASLLGINELLPHHPIIAEMGRIFCSDGAITQPLCSNMMYLIVGSRSEEMLNATMFPAYLGHAPAGAAVRQIVHYGQHMNNSFFSRYNHGALGNWIAYGQRTAPEYPLEKITARVFLHYVEKDTFADPQDVDTLWRRLGRPIAKILVPHPTFSHLDFMWGIGANELLYQNTINIMNTLGPD